MPKTLTGSEGQRNKETEAHSSKDALHWLVEHAGEFEKDEIVKNDG